MSDRGSTPYPSRRALREQAATTGTIPVVTQTGAIELPTATTPPPVLPTTDVSLPTPPPLPSTAPSAPRSRRERRAQEQLLATGAIPVAQETTNPPVAPVISEQPVPEVVAPPAPHQPAPTPVSAPTPTVPPDLVTPPSTVATHGTPPPGPQVAPENSVSPGPSTVEAKTPAETGTAPGRPMSRRERRAREAQGLPVPDASVATPTSSTLQATTASVASVGPGLPVTTTPTVDTAVATPQPAQADPQPLPPVFAAPVSPAEAPTASSRTVGGATEATHALILPVAPSMDITGPIGDTGEVLITGNIPLPRHVSEQALTGVVQVEEDDSDFEHVSTDTYTTPIRATEAVSSRTVGIDQPMIRKPRWGAASIALGFSAAILGLTAVALLGLALLTDIIELPF